METTTHDINMKKSIQASCILAAILFLLFTGSNLVAQIPTSDPLSGSVFNSYTANSAAVPWSVPNFQSFQDNIVDNSIEGDLKKSDMWFRMMFPQAYNISRTEKYPLIIFLHGSGESGTDNAAQLKWGGQTHHDAVVSNEFPGLLFYPQQAAGGQWSANGYNAGVDRIMATIKKLIKYYNVDPNRIYMHGLSGGGEGTWYAMMYYPEVIAAGLPMSAAKIGNFVNNSYDFGDGPETAWSRYIHIPIWLSIGGADPIVYSPEGVQTVGKIRDEGGSIRFTFLPTYTHNTWSYMYNQDDLFTWMLSHKKNDIHVFYGHSQFCADEPLPNVRMGLSAGFDGYEWARNGITISGATSNEYIATQEGTYTARFSRGGVWTDWSDPVYVDNNKALSPTPVITDGNKTTALPGLDGSQTVTLSKVSGPGSGYMWYQDAVSIPSATDSFYLVTQGGAYTFTSKTPAGQEEFYVDFGRTLDGIPDLYYGEYAAEPEGCTSAPSNEIIVTTSSGPNAPLPPKNLFAFTRTVQSIELIWDDQSDNEDGFEIYRATNATGPYVLVTRLSAQAGTGPMSYMDINLQSGITYYYKIRTYNYDGASPASPVASATTSLDTQPPTPPTVERIGSSASTIDIAWSGATDDQGIESYQVFLNGVLVETTNIEYYQFTGLSAGQLYAIVVKAVDGAGNVSTASNQLLASAVNNGLNYDYYHIRYLSYADQIESHWGSTFIRSGRVDNFDITPRDQEDNFAFIFYGNILIETAGNYHFYSRSDDGSKIRIDGNVVYSNDGTHACNESGTQSSVYLSAGFHDIEVRFFERTGGECLEVRWDGPGIAKSLIPDEVLLDAYTLPTRPAAPTGLGATAMSYNQIDLAWSYGGAVDGFEIYRSLDNVNYSILASINSSEVQYSDENLQPNTTYYYKVKAVSLTNGSSDFSNMASATTGSLPPVPNAPSALIAMTLSSSEIQLDWTQNSNDETGFGIYRSTNGTDFVMVGQTATDIVTYTDQGLTGNSTYYYYIRAMGDGGNSAPSNTASAQTFNNPPVVSVISNRSVEVGTTLTFDITATDPDGDQLTFSKYGTNWPAGFGDVINSGFNRATLEFVVPSNATMTSYDLQVSASDGDLSDVSNVFTITVNDNSVPQFVPALTNQSMDEGSSLTVNINVVDSDLPISITANNLPTFASLTDNGDGTAQILFTPSVGQADFYRNIEVIAMDGLGGISIESFNLQVNTIDISYRINVNLHNYSGYQNGWNYIGNSSISGLWPYENLVTADGETKNIDLNLTGVGFDPSRSFQSPGITEGGIYDAAIQQYGFITGNRWNNVFYTLSISGLTDALTYDLGFLSSLKDAFDAGWSYQVNFLVNGEQITFDPRGNADQLVEFTGVRPQNGIIEIQLNSNGLGDHKSILNAFFLEAYYDDGGVPAAPSNLTLNALDHRRVELQWDDNSANEQNFEVWRRAQSEANFQRVLVLDRNMNYAIDSINLQGTTRYYYYISAINGAGSTSSGIVSVITDNAPPIINPVNSIVVSTGSTSILNLSAYDPEGGPVILDLLNAPDFVDFTDNGNGTALVSVQPGEADQGQVYALTFTAADNQGASSSVNFDITVINAGSEQLIYLNLTQTGTEAGSPWNDVTSTPANGLVINGLTDINGASVPVTVQLSGTWNGAVDKGTTELNGELFPDEVAGIYWESSGAGTFTFQNLVANAYYTFTLFGSSIFNKDYDMDYTINGQSVSVDPYQNIDKIVKIAVVQANSSGVIVMTMTSNTSGVEPFVNAMIVERITNSGTLAAPSNLVAYTQSMTEIDLNWADNSGTETNFDIYRFNYELQTNTLVASVGANVQSYSDSGLDPDTKYGYTVLARNGGGESELSNEAIAITPEKIIYVNVNSSSDVSSPTNGIYWNNLSSIPVTSIWSNLVVQDGSSTSEELYLISDGVGGDTGNGIATGDGIYPDNACLTSFYVNPGEIMEWLWRNLDVNKKYNISFFGSRKTYDGAAQDGETFYKSGPQTVYLNSWGNNTDRVLIRGLSPDSEGFIPFQFEATPWGIAANYGFLGVIELQVYDEKTDQTRPDNTYYVAADSDPTVLSNWSSNPDGTGTNPAGFSEPGLTFEIPSGVTINLSSGLSITGAGSTLRFNNNTSISCDQPGITIQASVLDIAAGANVQLTGTNVASATIVSGSEGINIRAGGILNIGDGTLQVSGTGSLNSTGHVGAVRSTEGTIEFTNTVATNSNLYATSDSRVGRLAINYAHAGQVILGSAVNISGVVDIQDGELVSNGNLVLLSDDTGTGKITQMGVGSSIVGDVEFQRYWERPRGGFYYIGTPVYDQTLADWASDFIVRGYDPDGWKNVNSYDESTYSWIPLSGLNATLTPGVGYNAYLYHANFTDDGWVRFSNRGRPVIGSGDDGILTAGETFDFNLSYTDVVNEEEEGWVLISNPYPCDIDWVSLGWETPDPAYISNVNPTVHIYNGQNRVYEAYSALTSSEIIIPPGQAFFVKTYGPNPILRISESAKTNTNGTFKRVAAIQDLLTMQLTNSDNENAKAYLRIKEGSTNGYDSRYDAFVREGGNMALSTINSDNSDLVINVVPEIENNIVLPLNTNVPTNGNYVLSFNGISSFNNGLKLSLRDKYTNEYVALEDENVQYAFSTNDSPASKGAERFELIVEKIVEISVPDMKLEKNDLVGVPVFVSNFRDIVSTQFSVQWNPDVVALESVGDYKLPGLGIGNFGLMNSDKGVLNFSWDSNSLTPVDVPDSTAIFVMYFKNQNSQEKFTEIRITDEPVSIEIADSNLDLLKYTVDNGSLQILRKAKISGKIVKSNGEKMSGVKLTFSGDGAVQSQWSDENGDFTFEGKTGVPYVLKAENEVDEGLSELSTLDIIYLRRHLLNIQPFNHYLTYWLGDLNGSKSLTALDIAIMRNIILGNGAEIQVPEWYFMCNDMDISDPYSITPGSFEFNIDHDSTDITIHGHQTGDISSCFTSSARIDNRDFVKFYLSEKDITYDGDKIRIPVKTQNFENINGFQFTVSWNEELYEFIDIENEGIQPLFNQDYTDQGKLTLIWDDESGKEISLNEESALLNLVFERKDFRDVVSTIEINSDITHAEVVKNLQKVKFVSEGLNISDKLYQSSFISNYPNPFDKETAIQFSLLKDQKVNIAIYDSRGVLVDRYENQFKKGVNEWVWNTENRLGKKLDKGIYICTIFKDNSVVSRKMIINQ